MKAFKICLCLAIALVALASCTSFKASGLSMAATPIKGTPVGDFRIELWVNEFLGGSAGNNLFNVSADATEGVIKEAIMKEIKNRGGDAAINVTIEHQASFINLLLNSITFAIYAPGTVVVTGTVIKY